MRRLALATCERLPGLAEDDRLALGPFLACGLHAAPEVWSAADVDWRGYDAVLVRSCWDYHHRAEEFRRWIDRLTALSIPLINTAALLQWNMDKRYLGDLEQQGVPIPATHFVAQGENVSLLDACARFAAVHPDVRTVVVKPTVSATAHLTWCTDAPSTRSTTDAESARFAEILRSSGALIQRFVPEVRTDGEWSILFFGGTFSHAVRKRPAAGDFRVQGDHGGSATLETPPGHLVTAARRVLAFVEHPAVYARVDGIEVDGAFQLLELELIEPELFFRLEPLAAERLARAVLAHLPLRDARQ